MRRNNTNTANATAANLGYEAQLWQMADALRNNMDAAEYKHVVLGLIFHKYISEALEAKHATFEERPPEIAGNLDRGTAPGMAGFAEATPGRVSALPRPPFTVRSETSLAA